MYVIPSLPQLIHLYKFLSSPVEPPLQVLPLPPNPVLSTAGGKIINSQVAVVPGKSVDGAAPLRLGLLAMKDPTSPRSANFILWPDHPFWNCSTPDELYRYLAAAFPQLDRLRENVPLEVAQAFVDARVGRFRDPQSCKRLVAEFPGAAAATVQDGDAAGGVNGAAVLILGDAAHVFPPGVALTTLTACKPLCRPDRCSPSRGCRGCR